MKIYPEIISNQYPNDDYKTYLYHMGLVECQKEINDLSILKSVSVDCIVSTIFHKEISGAVWYIYPETTCLSTYNSNHFTNTTIN